MIKKILFDVDGVLLSEEHYFDASALTVWELLISEKYVGLLPEAFKTDYSLQEIGEIRSKVFEEDSILRMLKANGLNANWDMIYLTVSYQLVHLLAQLSDKSQVNKWLQAEIDRNALKEMGIAFRKEGVLLNFSGFVSAFNRSKPTKLGLFQHLNTLAKKKLGVETTVFSEDRTLWSVGEHISQEWYVGDDHVQKSTGRPSVQTGKQGFLANEKTICAPERIDELFHNLLAGGIKIGIGTGRPELETIQPFTHLGWINHFDENFIVTADDVLKAERAFPEYRPLAKPNPFTYVLGLKGRSSGAIESLNTKLPVEGAEEILIVGDSLADLLAARKMGCKFAAVLTGLSGQKARAQFEEKEANFILNDVLEVKEVLLDNN
ncbi:HAD family hydrolase [Bacillus sp. 2205SS5-2]|uniref:HAD family hydrolase n=1 Tax=Bacillus sp. 2205SS5-2 TaxID=3109031 RepID=UPI0030077131